AEIRRADRAGVGWASGPGHLGHCRAVPRLSSEALYDVRNVETPGCGGFVQSQERSWLTTTPIACAEALCPTLAISDQSAGRGGASFCSRKTAQTNPILPEWQMEMQPRAGCAISDRTN